MTIGERVKYVYKRKLHSLTDFLSLDCRLIDDFKRIGLEKLQFL